MRVLSTSLLLAVLLLVLVASIALAGWSEPAGHRWLA
jgi:hypothetical protein